MIDTNSCYYELKTKSVKVTDTFHEYFNSLKWFTYHLFLASPMPKFLIDNEPALKALHEQFEIAHIGVLKLDRNHLYKWHIDGNRGVGINMLLTPDIHSYCLFGERDKYELMQTEFIKLEYKVNTFYVFNTQCPHCIINFEEPRYLFSVEFAKDKNSLTFNDVKEWVVKNNL